MKSSEKDYKKTLNLPQTEFPMKANLGEREPSFLQFWETNQLYQKILEKNKSAPRFVFHDGPPYANGHIHYGTILNKILKDIVVKQKNMTGFLSEFIPGWDCHGLPIELQVDKELGSKRVGMNPAEIRKKCREYAKKFIDIQRAEFKRLGCFADWENPYLTMSASYEAAIAREFGRCVGEGIVYRAKKPVYWCTSCRTALAEAEVEYADHTSPSIYVKFRVAPEDEKKLQKKWGLKKEDAINIVIWTTTPWTLPANLGIALHPNFTYVAFQMDQEAWVVADGLLQRTLEAFGSPDAETLLKFAASELEQVKCLHPFLPKHSLVILGPHVTLEAGTGCVHTAPGHGQEDYVVGKKYQLEPFAPIDDAGKFTEEAGADWLTGLKVEAANKPILEHLEKSGHLAKQETLRHPYPHCWRCKNPVIFRATKQWFISMEEKELRNKALRAIDQVEWIPDWGRNRIHGMMSTRPDWCISRQRLWGVPIISFVCADCLEEGITSQKIIDGVADAFEKHPLGSDLWYEENFSVPSHLKCPQCGKSNFVKRDEVLDVWFDSGISYAAVLEAKDKKLFPADLYLEGSDQHRGWFHTSLLTAIATRGKAPYKKVLTHGFVVDADGKKLSKSAGNYIPPDTVLKKQGAEMLRLWVATEDYRNDIRFSGEILDQLSDTYRKIRNTCRYLLGNLFDFNPEKDAVAFRDLVELDRFALHLLHQLVREVSEAYASFEFHRVTHELNRFCTVELSSFYLDVLKDRLYTEKRDGNLRRSAQTVLFQLLEQITLLMAPILSFTAEEVWQQIPTYNGKKLSVFLKEFPKPNPSWENTELFERWERFLKMREVVTKALELARAEKTIGNSLQAKVVLEGSSDQAQFLKSFGETLSDLFIVSQVDFGKAHGSFVYESEEVPHFKVSVEKAEGSKCERCWKHSMSVGKKATHVTLCDRCVNVCQDHVL